VLRRVDEDRFDGGSAISELAHPFAPESSRCGLMHFRTVVARRVARVMLAMRLYQVDHGGQLPVKLADLVPAYLTELPQDPCFRDAHSLGYVNDGKNPRLYSVGELGTDDGGKMHEPHAGEDVQEFEERGTYVFIYNRKVGGPSEALWVRGYNY
jgi:hypothetical protein